MCSGITATNISPYLWIIIIMFLYLLIKTSSTQIVPLINHLWDIELNQTGVLHNCLAAEVQRSCWLMVEIMSPTFTNNLTVCSPSTDVIIFQITSELIVAVFLSQTGLNVFMSDCQLSSWISHSSFSSPQTGVNTRVLVCRKPNGTVLHGCFFCAV